MEHNKLTTKERGDALEQNVEHIFKVANFKTSRNVRIAGYEIDVLAEIGDRTIIVECKNYQSSKLTVRNLLHQWKSKNDIIKASKIVVLIAGVELQQSDINLAQELDISLWDQGRLTELFDLSLQPDKLREQLLESISFKPVTIAERYRDSISFMTMHPYVSSLQLSEEIKYSRLNKWLRSFIITELSINSTSAVDRAWHISIFEGLKTHKGGLFGFSTKTKTETEYWNAIRSALNQEVLDEIGSGDDLRVKYLDYMNQLEEEWSSSLSNFETGDYYERLYFLISTRLYFATLKGERFLFSANKKGMSSISIDPRDDEEYIITIPEIDSKKANTLSWIFTSQWYREKIESGYKYFWIFNSYRETAEMLFRYFTEYCDYQEGDKLHDQSIISFRRV